MSNKLLIQESDDAESLHNLIKEAVSHEQGLIENAIARVEKELSVLEGKHGMKTTQFIGLYSEGKLSDDSDFVDWSGLHHLHQKLLKKRVQPIKMSPLPKNPLSNR